jgi:hypothetical protein
VLTFGSFEVFGPIRWLLLNFSNCVVQLRENKLSDMNAFKKASLPEGKP